MVQSFPKGLAITAIGAKDLAKRKRFGAQDPYLAFYLQGHRKFTRVAIKGGVTPVWNQTIRYNHITDSSSKEHTTLRIFCIHEKTGVSIGVGDGLIGNCEIDLKRTLFSSKDGLHEGWFQLTYDGKESGQVHLRLQLEEPSSEEDAPESAPLRPDTRHLKAKMDKKIEKAKADQKGDKKHGKDSSSSSVSLSMFRPSSSLANPIRRRPSERAGSTIPLTVTATSSSDQSVALRRVPTNRLYKPRSMADIKDRNQAVTFQEPTQRRNGSKSMEEVRAQIVTPTSGMEDDDSTTASEAYDIGDKTSITSPRPQSMTSPKVTFTSQDGDGNVNQLNFLTAPFDPTWLEATPQILRRALDSHLYYQDLQQMQINHAQEITRPQSQQGFVPYPQALFISEGHSFQAFAQAHNQHLQHQTASEGAERPPNVPQKDSYPPSTQQPPLNGMGGGGTRPGQGGPTVPAQSQMRNSLLSQQPQWSKFEIPDGYPQNMQPQPQQPGNRSKRNDLVGTSKHLSLPPRNPAHSSQQYSRSTGDDYRNGDSSSRAQQPSSLGPAAGYLPDTYSKEHQRALSTQLARPKAQVNEIVSQPNNLPDPNQVKINLPSPLEVDRPMTSMGFYSDPTPSASPSTPGNAMNGLISGRTPVYFTSPVPQEQAFPSQHSQQTSAQSSVIFDPRGPSPYPGSEPYNSSQISPALPIPTKFTGRVKDVIGLQYAPRPTQLERNEIEESYRDNTMGRRFLARYSVGMRRERSVFEGYYLKERSPSLADGLTAQSRPSQPPLSKRPSQRQMTMDQEGNDRVIIKYIRWKRDWETDCMMLRYLTCPHPEEKLEGQYVDYPQPQQTCQNVSPYVVGLYETFIHTHGKEGERKYLSVLQWYSETLESFIKDCIASGEGLEVTLPIIRCLIECVAYIHSRKICHLNIKTSNFVRDPYSKSCLDKVWGRGWKLIDFEGARIMDEESLGRCTYQYAAPEVLMTHTRGLSITARASQDIWSLGLVIYELLTDKPLFKTEEQAKQALLNGDIGTHPGNHPGSHSGNYPGNRRSMQPVRYYDARNVHPAYIPLLDAMLVHDPDYRLLAADLLKLDLFTKPIVADLVPEHQWLRNNTIQSLTDMDEARLCSRQILGILNNSHESVQRQQMAVMALMEGLGRILDSPFDQVPRLFMLVPPMVQDLDSARSFRAGDLFQNKSLRLVLLCEGLAGQGEDAHMTDHRGYVLEDPVGFMRDVGKLLLHLTVISAIRAMPGPLVDQQRSMWKLTGTALDNCQRWFPSARSYYESLQTAIQRMVGPAPGSAELRSLRGPTLKHLEQWLARLVRRQSQLFQAEGLASKASRGDRTGRAGQPYGVNGGYDDHSDQMGAEDVEEPEVTGPGGGEGYGGLFKVAVGPLGDRWVCRGCVSRHLGLTVEAIRAAGATSVGGGSETSPYLA